MWKFILNFLASPITSGINYFNKKQELKTAIMDQKIKLAQSDMTYNSEWELRSLINAGWKDDILFYGVIGVFVWAGIDPQAANQYFQNLSVLPEWFITTFVWLVASVIGVRKFGEYAPSVIKSIKGAMKHSDVSKSYSESINQIGDEINRQIKKF